MKRIFWIVLDSAGIGEAPDANKFGDIGSNTWKSCYDSGKLHIPNMEKIGIYQIDGMEYAKRHRESDRKFCKNAGIILWKGYDDRTLGNGGNRNTGSTSQISNGFPNAFIEEFSKGQEERFYVICRIQAHRSFMIMAGSRKRQEH